MNSCSSHRNLKKLLGIPPEIQDITIPGNSEKGIPSGCDNNVHYTAVHKNVFILDYSINNKFHLSVICYVVLPK